MGDAAIQIESVPPCRVLFRDGQPCEEIITERPYRPETFRPVAMPSRELGTIRERAERARPVGRPRIHPHKPKPHAGKGHAWNRMDAVTVERILELQAQGLTGDQIGERLGCTRHTIYGRLRANRRLNPETAAQDDALRTCQCGKRKWASHDVCRSCGRRK